MSSALDTICFSSKLSTVKVGQVIRVAGSVISTPKNFKILLGNDIDQSTDIQLALKFQFGDEPYVVRNSYSASKNAWDDVSGEITDNLVSASIQNPIKPGSNFELAITTEKDRFLISLNGSLFCTYKYRHSLDGIKRISIYGDIKDIVICDHHIQSTEMQAQQGEFVGSIPVVQKGNCLVFHGQLKNIEGGEFTIELLDAENGENVLYAKCEADSKKMTCNYRIKGLITYYPFHNSRRGPVIIEANEKFQIDSEVPMKAAIGITQTHIYFVVNGMLFFAERHDELDFLDKPLKYRISVGSLDVKEINVHSLGEEIESLRAQQSKIKFSANEVARDSILKQILSS